jgi:DNA-binding transcriptional MerR regulator
MTEYLIGEVARLTGINSKTIRYYEGIGLIPPASRRNPSHASPGYRVYSEADVRRLTLIKRAKLLDLSLEQLKQLLHAANEGCCEAVKPKFHALLESKLQEAEAKLRQLVELRDTLRWLLSGTSESWKKPSAAASECFTTDCGLTVPVEAVLDKP